MPRRVFGLVHQRGAWIASPDRRQVTVGAIAASLGVDSPIAILQVAIGVQAAPCRREVLETVTLEPAVLGVANDRGFVDAAVA